MPNQSVKIDDATQQRLRALAERQGITPHALMVRAIGSELDRLDAETSFVERAGQALARAVAGGPVYDGPAYAAHLRQKVRAARQTSATPAQRPAATTLAAVGKAAKPRA
jgi:predicted transcriptional regulator